jgi:hypothetical protein
MFCFVFLFHSISFIDTSRICLSAHKTIEAGNENRLFTMDYIARLDFTLLFCVHSSKFGKCLLDTKIANVNLRPMQGTAPK